MLQSSSSNGFISYSRKGGRVGLIQAKALGAQDSRAAGTLLLTLYSCIMPQQFPMIGWKRTARPNQSGVQEVS